MGGAPQRRAAPEATAAGCPAPQLVSCRSRTGPGRAAASAAKREIGLEGRASRPLITDSSAWRPHCPPGRRAAFQTREMARGTLRGTYRRMAARSAPEARRRRCGALRRHCGRRALTGRHLWVSPVPISAGRMIARHGGALGLPCGHAPACRLSVEGVRRHSDVPLTGQLIAEINLRNTGGTRINNVDLAHPNPRRLSQSTCEKS